jgi:hypothetical protein
MRRTIKVAGFVLSTIVAVVLAGSLGYWKGQRDSQLKNAAFHMQICLLQLKDLSDRRYDRLHSGILAMLSGYYATFEPLSSDAGLVGLTVDEAKFNKILGEVNAILTANNLNPDQVRKRVIDESVAKQTKTGSDNMKSE